MNYHDLAVILGWVAVLVTLLGHHRSVPTSPATRH